MVVDFQGINIKPIQTKLQMLLTEAAKVLSGCFQPLLVFTPPTKIFFAGVVPKHSTRSLFAKEDPLRKKKILLNFILWSFCLACHHFLNFCQPTNSTNCHDANASKEFFQFKALNPIRTISPIFSFHHLKTTVGWWSKMTLGWYPMAAILKFSFQNKAIHLGQKNQKNFRRIRWWQITQRCVKRPGSSKVISTRLKKISQIGNLPQTGVILWIKNIWNHHLGFDFRSPKKNECKSTTNKLIFNTESNKLKICFVHETWCRSWKYPWLWAFSNATKSLLEQKPSASVLRVAAVSCSPRNGGK